MGQIKNEYKRIKWLELARTLAILFVLLCHSTEEGIYSLQLNQMNVLSMPSRIFAFASFTLGRLGVPIFLMISGYLLIGGNYTNEKIIRFIKKNCTQLFAVTMFWFLLYDLFLKYILGYSVRNLYIIEDVLMLHDVKMSHVWYMPMILGFYILIPFVSDAIANKSIKLVLGITVFYSVICFGIPTVNAIFTMIGWENLKIQISNGFSGGIYGIFIVMGYLVKQNVFKKISTVLIASLCVTTYFLGVVFQLLSYSMGIQYNIWYNNILVLCSGVCLFELISRIHMKGFAVISLVSKYSFGMYLTHNIFKALIVNSVISINCNRPTKVILLFGIISLLSFGASVLINKIPKIGKILTYTK